MGDALATAHILLQLLEVARTSGVTDWTALRDTLRGRRKKGARRQRQRRGAPDGAVAEAAPVAQSQPLSDTE
jgi:hypothetical protein